MPRHDYVALGEQGIQELLAQEHAVVWTEVEAKLADRQWPTLPCPIDPHHLTNARHRLLDAGVIETSTKATRGGRAIPVIVPTNQRLRKRAITDAAARKRLLQTRFLTWASGSSTAGVGVIGKAGEDVVHAAITAASPYGYRLLNPVSGQVRRMLGRDLSFGSLDNVAVLTTIHLEEFTPTGQYIVAVEVKNIRSWIYRSTAELYQLLYKAAQLQLDHPTHRFLPVFVCRRAQYMTNQMAEALGFYVISTKRQYVPASIAGRELDEVNTELGYDLEPAPASPPPALVKHFTTTLQSVAERTVGRWSVTAQALVENFKALRNDRLTNRDREELTHELLDIAADIHDNHRGTITNYGDLGAHRGITAVGDLEDDVPF